MLFENQHSKSLQYKRGSYIRVSEWSLPRATPEEFERMVEDCAVVFDARLVPRKHAGTVLNRSCQTLASVLREDHGQTVWRAFLGSEKQGEIFDVQACRRVKELLILGFNGALCAFELETGKHRWAVKLPGSRIRALRVPSDKTAVIVHGTCSMFRVNLTGRVEWETFGAASFGTGLRLCKDVIEVRDVDRNIYLIDYRTGDFAIRPPPLAERMGVPT